MFRAGFFYKLHSILEDWVAVGRNNAHTPDSAEYVCLYIDETNDNALIAIDSNNQETVLINEGGEA